MDFDETRLYYSHQQLQARRPDEEEEEVDPAIAPPDDDNDCDLSAVRRHFREFLRT
jgi:hypothetical protein